MVANDGTSRGRRPPGPAVDERLIMPETRYEALDGQVLYVSPADYPHGTRHSKLAALLEAHVDDGFDAAVDMLTRTSEKSDFAPDASVFPEGPDPHTGGRQLEHLAFEVVATQTLPDAGRKAAELVRRGVRRVFAIDVERQRALEWSTATDAWRLLRNDDAIDDPCFALPLPLDALVGAADADDAVAKALLAKHNPVLAEALDARERYGREAGIEEGRLHTLVATLRARGLVTTAADEARVRREVDADELDACLVRGLSASTLDEVLGRCR